MIKKKMENKNRINCFFFFFFLQNFRIPIQSYRMMKQPLYPGGIDAFTSACSASALETEPLQKGKNPGLLLINEII